MAAPPVFSSLGRWPWVSTMNLLLIVVLACLIAVSIAGRSRPGLKVLAVPLVVVGLAVVGAKEVLRWMNPPGAAEAVWDQAVGHALGEMIAKNHPGGGTVVVLDFSSGEGLATYARARLAGLAKGWAAGSFKAEAIGAPAIAAALGLGDGPQVLMPGMLSRSAYAALLAPYPGAVAVVSFMGVPSNLTAADVGTLPPLYALDHAPPALEAGGTAPAAPTVRALVRLRSNVDFSAPAPRGSPEDVFNARYERVTYAP